MTWANLADLRRATRIEFTASLARRHCFVLCASGRWTRVLDAPPREAIHVRGRVYHMPETHAS